MTANRKSVATGRRERRAFSAEFKAEAVRRRRTSRKSRDEARRDRASSRRTRRATHVPRARGLTVGIYAYRKPVSWHANIDDVLLARVRVAHAARGDTYDAPRVHEELQAEALLTSRTRVARLMREE